MKLRRWLRQPRARLDVVAGMVDGILNALTLASGSLLDGSGGATGILALKVGCAASLTTLFVFFVAHYAELRTEVARFERQLNLTSHGSITSGAMGRQLLWEAAVGAGVASGCGFVGAVVPLLLAALLPGPSWLSLPLTIALLGGLGGLMAKSFYGRPALWALITMIGGVLLALVGFELHLVT